MLPEGMGSAELSEMSIATPTNTSLTHEGHRSTLRIAFTYKVPMIKSSQFAEVKAIQLVLEIAEREKWPALYTDSGWRLMP